MPPGTFEGKHYHKKSRQFFYILSGEATIETAEGIFNLKRQEGIEIQPMMPHKISNKSTDDLVFIEVSNPKSHGDKIVLEV